MKKKDFDKLEEGIYEVDFGDDCPTLAMIGSTLDEGNWIAPMNFTYPVVSGSVNYDIWIKRISYAKMLLSQTAYRMFKYRIR